MGETLRDLRLARFTTALYDAIRRMRQRPKRRAPLTIYDLDLVPRGRGGERG
jgi:hypothetical protein